MTIVGGQGDADWEAAVLDLLALRADGATVCPSDVARDVHDGPGDGWRAAMDDVRDAAARLAERGVVVVTQSGREVDLDTVRGPVRIGLRTR